MDALPTVKQEKIKLVEINEYLTCPLCKGYYIDATTISECLHSFCRSCIIQFLQENSHCPICEVIINKAKPNIKLDKTLQDIVYKLVPELFLREMARRQKFYSQHPKLAAKVAPEERGEDTERTIFNPKDLISLSIEYISDDSTPGAISVPAPLEAAKNSSSKICDSNDTQMKRFLQCPGMCRIEVLKKFVQNKYNVNTVLFHIEILYKRVPLPNHYTLIDIAYIYSWKRNEPMKFFFRIMEKSAVEKSETQDNVIDQHIFVKPVKTPRSSDKTKSHRNSQNKTKKIIAKSPISTTEEKSIEDKSDVIINTDKIKDEIKNKLQDIGKGPVYTNITLNRSNNVEIITKVQKVSNKNGQPIGLNIIKQTVKKTGRSPEKNPEKIANGCKNDVVLNSERSKESHTAIDAVKKENGNESKQNEELVKAETDSVETKQGCESKGSNQEEANVKEENLVKKEDTKSKNLSPKHNKENQKNKTEHEKPCKTEEKSSGEVKQEETRKEEANIVIQAVLKKKDFDIDEEKSNFLKSIELTARSALQTIQSLKNEKPANPIPTPHSSSVNLIIPTTKPTQKRKTISPIKNEKKRSKKAKTSPIKLLPKEPAPSVDRLIMLADKQKNGGDLQSLFNSCKINIPSSLSITLKESSEDDRDRRSAASLKPVQNYIEILKLPDSNQSDKSGKSDIENRFKSKSAPNLPCNVNTVGVKESLTNQQAQTFQKMFEDSIKKPELSKVNSIPNYSTGNNNNNNHQKEPTENATTQNAGAKRNLMEITSQLHKKTKLEVDNGGQKTSEALPKVAIPRLSSQKKASPPSQVKFQQTFANMHSPSLGLNYTVSVAQNTGRMPAKIEAKVEESLKSPVKIEEGRSEEAQNLIKKEKLEEGKTNGKVLATYQHVKRSPLASSPRANCGKTAQKQPAISPKPNSSPIPKVPSPRAKVSPEKPSGAAASPAFSPNHILEKYKIQNLAQLTASLNFNPAVFGMSHTTHLAALQQAMLLNQFELHNRQNWQLSQYEKYLQNRLLSKEN